MAGTKIGGAKARDKNLEHNPNHYRDMGRADGKFGRKDGTIKGFAAMTPEKRREAGRVGGTISRRVK